MADSETLATSTATEAPAAEAAVVDKVDTGAAVVDSGAAPAATEGAAAASEDAGKAAEPAPFDWKVLAGEDADALTLLGEFKSPADLYNVVKASKADWREEYAAGDADALKRLQRFKDKGSWFKSYRAMESKMGDADYVRKPSDKATPEEIAEFRKAIGVPDDVNGYKVNLPEGTELSATQKASLENYIGLMHAAGATQAQIDAGIKADLARQQMFEQEMADQVLNARKNTEDELRTKWPGKEYRANFDLVNRVIADNKEYLGDGFLSLKLEGGGLLGDDPRIIEFLADLGRERYGAGPMASGEPMSAVSLDEELAKYMGMVGTAEYAKPAVQNRVREIFALKERIAQRGRAA